MSPDIAVAIDELSHNRSTKRRSAAKRLRKAAAPKAIKPLLLALERETRDRRTWETQYQMLMALGACKAATAIPLLKKVLDLPLEPMVHLAARDALVRCSDNTDASVLDALQSGSLPWAEGAIRALAMTRDVPSPNTVATILEFVSEAAHQQVRFWVAAAAPGWPGDTMRHFLDECVRDGDAETQRAAKAAIEGRYLKWSPL